MRIFVAILIFISGTGWALGQENVLQNDVCEKSILMHPGDHFSHLSNEFASASDPAEKPATTPTTCIITIENDLWFHFETEAAYSYYEITIAHNYCTTPAGLQALLIRADGCTPGKYEYSACSNLESEDTIKMYLGQSQPGLKYFIWIDGYDGTVCDFDLSIKGHALPPSAQERFKYTRYDYELQTTPSFSPQDVKPVFANNVFTIEWSADASEDVEMYVVERMPVNGGNFATVVGFVPPKNQVAGGLIPYEFTDYRTRFLSGKYCYRLVKVASNGEKSFSELFWVEAKVVESFYVADVTPGTEPGKYVVKYVNMAKKQDFTCSVLDENLAVLKSLSLPKEPIRDGTITLNMADYPPGEYFFKMATAKEEFLKKFTVTGR